MIPVAYDFAIICFFSFSFSLLFCIKNMKYNNIILVLEGLKEIIQTIRAVLLCCCCLVMKSCPTFHAKRPHWKRLWCWEGLGAGREGDDRGWDGWMASPTRWTCVWVNSGNWWCTGRPGMLWFMGSQRVGHDWTELKWKSLKGLDFHKAVWKISPCLGFVFKGTRAHLLFLLLL